MTSVGMPLINEQARDRLIGRTTPLQPLEPITASDLRRYVDATGDANPLWLDDGFARSMGYRGRVLPPVLVGWVPFSVRQSGIEVGIDTSDLPRQLQLPASYTNIRNAGNEIEWLKPVYLGELLSIQSCIVAIVAREGKRGWGVYVTREEQILNSEQTIVSRRRQTVVLLPEAKVS